MNREMADSGDVMIGSFKYDRNRVPKIMMISVTDPSKNERFKSYEDSGSFTLEIREEGIYEICFFNTGNDVRTVTLTIDEKLKQQRHNELMSKGEMDPLQASLRQLIEFTKHLASDIEHQSNQEHEMRNVSELVCERVVWFTIYSLIIFIGMGVWKIAYLHQLFKKQKLI